MPSFFHRLCSTVRDSLAARVHHWLLYSQREQELTRFALTSQMRGVSDAPVADHEVIVNLTTHGYRIHEVHLAIESLMQGSILPNRIILWLSDKYDSNLLPQTLRHQSMRGLEIRYIPDVGPYTKLVPALQQFPDSIHVTIDDDIIYPYDTLEQLLIHHRLCPEAICANRILDVQVDSSHHIRTLSSWPELIDKKRISARNFFEGVGGVLYPPHSLHPQVTDQQSFSQLAPTADDIWFNVMARLNHTEIRCANMHYSTFPLLINERVQDIALWRCNNGISQKGKSLNDKQLQLLIERYGVSFTE